MRSDKDWKSILDPHTYHITREAGTESPFTGRYWNTDTPGTYLCSNCRAPLFDSTSKYHSGCGWPSFYREIEPERIKVAHPRIPKPTPQASGCAPPSRGDRIDSESTAAGSLAAPLQSLTERPRPGCSPAPASLAPLTAWVRLTASPLFRPPPRPPA